MDFKLAKNEKRPNAGDLVLELQARHQALHLHSVPMCSQGHEQEPVHIPSRSAGRFTINPMHFLSQRHQMNDIRRRLETFCRDKEKGAVTQKDWAVWNL